MSSQDNESEMSNQSGMMSDFEDVTNSEHNPTSVISNNTINSF